ncbi:fibronectin type III domain-containing protein, partial [Escherichia coli]|uniref:fibronectin type III domain-containing protein n=1 Tax=Escherichia coli TaxID=562 RepID=UPI003CE4D8DD
MTNTAGPDVAPVNAHAFTVSGLAANTTYYFQAVATDDSGQTQKSDVVAITTLPIPLPDWSISGFNGSPTQTT